MRTRCTPDYEMLPPLLQRPGPSPLGRSSSGAEALPTLHSTLLEDSPSATQGSGLLVSIIILAKTIMGAGKRGCSRLARDQPVFAACVCAYPCIAAAVPICLWLPPSWIICIRHLLPCANACLRHGGAATRLHHAGGSLRGRLPATDCLHEPLERGRADAGDGHNRCAPAAALPAHTHWSSSKCCSRMPIPACTHSGCPALSVACLPRSPNLQAT